MNVKNSMRMLTRAMPAFAVLALVYTLLIFILPASSKTMEVYNFTPMAYKVVLFAIALPTLLVWFAAFLGYSKLNEYASSIKKTAEGAHFDKLATGAAWLAWSLPVAAISTILLNALAGEWKSFYSTSIILSNYINLVMPLVSFTLIGTAARGLTSNAKLTYNLISSRALTFLFVLTGVLYCFLTFRHFDLTSLNSTNNPYFLPIWLMVITVTIPYLYAWFVGLLAAYELSLFSRNVRGIFYKQALKYLSVGLIVVVVSFIALQYLNSVKPRVGYIVFDYRILLTMIFRVIGGIGFILLALGAFKLKKIEEV